MSHPIIIAGAGLVGSAMAIALARAGLNVALIEYTPQDKRLASAYDGRTSAIAHGSMKVLESIGVWQHIAASDREAITDIRVCDEGGRHHVHYDHLEASGEPFGHIIENRLLREALYNALEDYPSITQYTPCHITAINAQDAYTDVTLNDGQTLRGSVLLVADGKRSKTRDLLGINTKTITYGQTAIVATIAHSKPHHGLAVEYFRPAGPFALLPMTGNRTNIVWSERDAMAARMMELDDDDFLAELLPHCGDYLGDITLTGPRHNYPLMLITAHHYTAPRAALIGDAGHGIHPIAGQGVNLGYRDVAVMAELIIEQSRLGLDVGSTQLLDHYQQWRQLDITSMVGATDVLNRLFSNAIPPIRKLRDVGLGLVNRTPPLKRFFMQHAMGMAGDLPKMMRGESI